MYIVENKNNIKTMINNIIILEITINLIELLNLKKCSLKQYLNFLCYSPLEFTLGIFNI